MIEAANGALTLAAVGRKRLPGLDGGAAGKWSDSVIQTVLRNPRISGTRSVSRPQLPTHRDPIWER